MFPIYCFTSDVRVDALRVYVYLMQKYWPDHPYVKVAGFTAPPFELPQGFQFYSIGDFADYPIQEWSTAVIKFMMEQDDTHFIWMQEDLWLLRRVDQEAVDMVSMLAASRPEIGRFCLTRDRANNKDILSGGYLGRLDLVESTNQIVYNFSYQCSLWRRDTLLGCMQPHLSPWQAELAGQEPLSKSGKKVFGTRQEPVRYLIAYQQGTLRLDGGYQGPEYALSKTDIEELTLRGLLPTESIAQ